MALKDLLNAWSFTGHAYKDTLLNKLSAMSAAGVDYVSAGASATTVPSSITYKDHTVDIGGTEYAFTQIISVTA